MAINYCVYVLLCDNGNYYTGYTTDMMRRYQEHLNGSTKSKYTRSFKPVKIAQAWSVSGSKAQAMQMECFIKKLTKLEKTQLLLAPEQLMELFPCQLMEEPIKT